MSNLPTKVEQKNLRINLSMRVDDKNLKQGIIVIYLKFFYNYAGKNILSYEAGFHFQIRKTENQLSETDLSNLFPTLFRIAHDTLRGMVAVRTLGTPLANYPVPLVDLNRIFNKK